MLLAPSVHTFINLFHEILFLLINESKILNISFHVVEVGKVLHKSKSLMFAS